MIELKNKELEITTTSAQETYLLGVRLGKAAVPGEVYTLCGDLGAGKTVLTQGIAEGLGITEAVNSPTFTILQVYEEGRMPLYHFDVYRIADPEEMDEIGYEEYFYGEGLSVVEWGSLIRELLPEHHYEIAVGRDTSKGYDYRRIVIRENTGD